MKAALISTVLVLALAAPSAAQSIAYGGHLGCGYTCRQELYLESSLLELQRSRTVRSTTKQSSPATRKLPGEESVIRHFHSNRSAQPGAGQ